MISEVDLDGDGRIDFEGNKIAKTLSSFLDCLDVRNYQAQAGK